MKRGWFLLLALSIGLNAGLLYTTLVDRRSGFSPPPPILRAPFICPPAPIPGDPHGPIQESGLSWEPMLRHRLRGMEVRVGLDAGQHQEEVRILEEMLPRILTGRDSVRDARRALHLAYQEQELDIGRIRTIVRRMNEAQARLDSLVTETMLREMATLSRDQRRRYMEALPWGCGMAPLDQGAGPRRPGKKR